MRPSVRLPAYERVTWDDLFHLAGRPMPTERGPVNGWRSLHCPIHDDRGASATISPDRRILICRGECSREYGIYAGAVAIGIARTEADAASILEEYADRRDGVMPRSRTDGHRLTLPAHVTKPADPREQAPSRRADPHKKPSNVPEHALMAAEYRYESIDGRVAVKVRWEWATEGQAKPAKTLRWYHVGEDDAYCWGLPDELRLRLYSEDHVRKVAQARGTVYLCEGERCADALNEALRAAEILNAVATTLGNGKDILPEHLDAMEGGGRIVVLADSDDKGRKQGQRHTAQLRERYADVRYLDLHPERPSNEKGLDVLDWVDVGHTVKELLELVESTPSTATAANGEEQGDSDNVPEWPDENEASWPEMDPAAYHGVLGDLVREVSPETESDPVALLLTALTLFGSAAGGGSYIVAEGTHHPPRFYSVLVGGTATGRKGTSLAVIRHFFECADEEWFRAVRRSGFGSGEAIVADLAGEMDEAPNPFPKQVLIIEPEFGRVLAVNERKDSTTSHILRDGWDGSPLFAIRRGQKASCYDAYLCLLGHISPEELSQKLTPDAIWNGFANRCLYAAVRRSKKLPSGGYLDPEMIGRYGSRLRAAIDFARQGRVMKRTPEAEKLWREIFMAEPEIDGLLGAFLARGIAQMNRLSVAYSLSRQAMYIDTVDILAAQAIWRYSVASVTRRIGSGLNTDERKLLNELRKVWPHDMTTRDIDRLFSGKLSAKEREQMIGRLLERGLASKKKTQTNGRPSFLVRALSLKMAEKAEKGKIVVTTTILPQSSSAEKADKGGRTGELVTPKAPQDDPSSAFHFGYEPKEKVATTTFSGFSAFSATLAENVREDAPSSPAVTAAEEPDDAANAWQDVTLDDQSGVLS
jgi:hypothetical protein